MDNCLLCLKAPNTFDDYIPIDSQKWWDSDILGTIEKHFWPIDDLSNTLGVCFFCWTKLNEFHIFYQNIVKAHRRNTDISKEEELIKCCIDPENFQASDSQLGKSDFTSNDETQFASEELRADDIKIEDSLIEYDQTFYESPTRASDQMIVNPMPMEKRKRGRPRKHHNIHEILVKKPKGKRGRPRKNSKLVQQSETSSQCAFISIGNCNPTKKKGRGRPRKTEKNYENLSGEKESELTVNGSDAISTEECSLVEELIDDKFSNLKEDVKVVNKKQKFVSLMKKRKPVQQHKDLMRNYIATSVRCMKFFKK